MSVDEQTKRRNPASEKPSRHSTIMRGVVTPALGIIAVAFIVLGILNATVWQPSKRIVATTRTNTQYVVSDPGVLQLVDSTVRIKISATDNEARVCAALGSSQDVTGWLAGSAYTRVTGLSDWKTLSHRASAASGTATAQTVGFSDSDLWTRVVCGDGSVELTTAQGASGKVLLIDANTKTTDAQSSSDSSDNNASQTDIATTPLTISMDWTRNNLPNYAMPFYFVAGLLIVAAILAASVFAIDPAKRRKQLDESKLKAFEETEMSVVEAFAGAIRPLASEIGSSFKRSSKTAGGHKRHAHGASSSGFTKTSRVLDKNQDADASAIPTTPRVIDVGSKNMVAVQQAETAIATHNDQTLEGAQQSQTPHVSLGDSDTSLASNTEQTAVISPEELQSYFARFAAETTSEIAKQQADDAPFAEDVTENDSTTDSSHDSKDGSTAEITNDDEAQSDTAPSQTASENADQANNNDRDEHNGGE